MIIHLNTPTLANWATRWARDHGSPSLLLALNWIEINDPPGDQAGPSVNFSAGTLEDWNGPELAEILEAYTSIYFDDSEVAA